MYFRKIASAVLAMSLLFFNTAVLKTKAAEVKDEVIEIENESKEDIASEEPIIVSKLDFEIKEFNHSYVNCGEDYLETEDIGGYVTKDFISIGFSERVSFKDIFTMDYGSSSVADTLASYVSDSSALVSELQTIEEVPTSASLIVYVLDGVIDNYSLMLKDDYDPNEDDAELLEEDVLQEEGEVEETEVIEEIEKTEFAEKNEAAEEPTDEESLDDSRDTVTENNKDNKKQEDGESTSTDIIIKESDTLEEDSELPEPDTN